MANVLVETPGVPTPEVKESVVAMPKGPAKVPEHPKATTRVPETPKETIEVPVTPEETKEIPVIPPPTELDKDQPSIINKENAVTICGKEIEIFPTKLKYFRNKTAAAYGVLKMVPMTEYLTIDRGTLDPRRDADQILFDFLIAVFDDPEFVKENYDNMTAADVEKIIKIFGRINGIDDKEEAARKNREAQAKH